MATSARRLGPDDRRALESLLAADQVGAVYLRSEMRLGGLRNGSWWAAVDGRGGFRAAMLAGPLVVPWIPSSADAAAMAPPLVYQTPPRVMVGRREHVIALQAARAGGPPVREVRDHQPLLALPRSGLTERPAPALRRSARRDLDVLAAAAAAMHHEEMGVDPMEVDPAGWRSRMGALIDRGWSWVWREDGEVVFKAELSAWTPEAVQIQGVWTNPALRNRGVARAGLAAVCADVFAEVPVCSLYVNAYNAPAIALYARLGFEHAGSYATMMF